MSPDPIPRFHPQEAVTEVRLSGQGQDVPYLEVVVGSRRLWAFEVIGRWEQRRDRRTNRRSLTQIRTVGYYRGAAPNPLSRATVTWHWNPRDDSFIHLMEGERIHHPVLPGHIVQMVREHSPQPFPGLGRS